MTKNNQKSIGRSILVGLLGLALWPQSTCAIETAEIEREAFRPLCLMMEDLSNLNFRATCSWGAKIVGETYDIINKREGIMPEWGELSINGTLRYHLSRRVINDIWLAMERGCSIIKNPKIVESLSDESYKQAQALFEKYNTGQDLSKENTIEDICEFVPGLDFRQRMTVRFGIVRLVYDATYVDDSTLKFPFNETDFVTALCSNAPLNCFNSKILRARVISARIFELCYNNPEHTSSDILSWKERLMIDPAMIIDDSQKL